MINEVAIKRNQLAREIKRVRHLEPNSRTRAFIWALSKQGKTLKGIA